MSGKIYIVLPTSDTYEYQDDQAELCSLLYKLKEKGWRFSTDIEESARDSLDMQGNKAAMYIDVNDMLRTF